MHCVIKLFKSLFLSKLSVLQSLNQLKFLLFHSTHQLFMSHSHLVLSQNFLLKLLSSHRSFLSFHIPSFLFCLNFLVSDHLLDRCCFQDILLSLNFQILFLLIKFHSSLLNFCSNFFIVILLCSAHLSLQILFDHFVKALFLFLFLHSSFSQSLLLKLSLLVFLFHRLDVIRLLSHRLNFLP